MSQLGFLSKLLLTFSITKRCRFHCLNCTGVSSNASNINNASPYTAVECQATSNSMLSNAANNATTSNKETSLQPQRKEPEVASALFRTWQ